MITKLDSEVVAERELLKSLAEAEQKIVAACTQGNVDWTILRPTLIYGEGRDVNITPLSRLIRRFGFMSKPLFPTSNVAMGLRMMNDMTFDATPAIRDFGWNPRPFHPVFDQAPSVNP